MRVHCIIVEPGGIVEYSLKDPKSMGAFKKQRVSINNQDGIELLFDHLLSELRIDIETVRGFERKR